MAKSMKAVTAGSMDEYIAGFPKDIQKMLETVRTTIQNAAPDAEEAIKYNIPTFRQNGNLVSFAAFKNHIGLYPAPRGVEEFKKEIAKYEGAKNTIKFALDTPLPLTLISRIVTYLVKRNQEKGKS